MFFAMQKTDFHEFELFCRKSHISTENFAASNLSKLVCTKEGKFGKMQYQMAGELGYQLTIVV